MSMVLLDRVGTQFPFFLWLYQVPEIALFSFCIQKKREDYACKVVTGQAWKGCISRYPLCIMESVTWPHQTARETGKCIEPCAQRENEMGFGDCIASLL